jgi:hypothetical protein
MTESEILQRIRAIPLKTFGEICSSALHHAAEHAPISSNMVSWYTGQIWGAYLMTNGDTEFFDQYQAAEKAIRAMEKL